MVEKCKRERRPETSHDELQKEKLNCKKLNGDSQSAELRALHHPESRGKKEQKEEILRKTLPGGITRGSLAKIDGTGCLSTGFRKEPIGTDKK